MSAMFKKVNGNIIFISTFMFSWTEQLLIRQYHRNLHFFKVSWAVYIIEPAFGIFILLNCTRGKYYSLPLPILCISLNSYEAWKWYCLSKSYGASFVQNHQCYISKIFRCGIHRPVCYHVFHSMPSLLVSVTFFHSKGKNHWMVSHWSKITPK